MRKPAKCFLLPISWAWSAAIDDASSAPRRSHVLRPSTRAGCAITASHQANDKILVAIDASPGTHFERRGALRRLEAFVIL